MNELKATTGTPKTAVEPRIEQVKPGDKLKWETPTLEDVSEQVMAQPYIRFT